MIAAVLLSSLLSVPAAVSALSAAPASEKKSNAAAAIGTRTSVGRDLVIDEPVTGNVVAILANVRVNARVGGNVIVWGGDAAFGPNGSVDGNLSVFAGDIAASPASPGSAPPVLGAVSTPGSLLRLYLEEMHRAPWEDSSRRPAVRGLRLLALSIWLGASLLLLWAFGSPFARAAASVEKDWTGSLLAGALGILTLFLAAAAALALLPSALSLPLALSLGAAAVAAKVFGMAALFLLLGQKLLKNVSPAKRPAALATGFAILAAASFVPFVGALLWSVASVVAVGIAISSRFGTPRVRVAMSAS